MRILWIGKPAQSAASGEEVYDRKIIDALATLGHDVDPVAPDQVPRHMELANLLGGIPYYRARFHSRANIERLREVARDYRAIVCSWEPLDRLAFQLGRPVVPILHNLTSEALVAMFPGKAVPAVLAAGARRWEEQAYRSRRFPAIATLSVADAAVLEAMAPGVPVIYAPPGLPPLVPLAVDAAFRPELLIAGTFDWRVKRRDVAAFAAEWRSAGAPLPVFADPLPPEAADTLKPQPMGLADAGDGIRLGLVPDRFAAGYKLKAGAYIAANAIVLSFADVIADFEGIADAGFFIRKIGGASEIAPLAAEFMAQPQVELRHRFMDFQRACAERFSWRQSAERIAAALTATMRSDA